MRDLETSPDIIKSAQQLLDGATPAPWSIYGVPHPGPDDELFIHPKDDGGAIARVQPLYADAELIAVAPELAQALAEEKYQYGVTYTGLNHGGQHFQWVESTGDTEWDKETLQLLVKRWKKRGQSPKIVRRRVSAPEVISE